MVLKWLIKRKLKKLGINPENLQNMKVLEQETDARINLLKGIKKELELIAEIYENYLAPVSNEEKKNFFEDLIQQVISQKLGSELGLNLGNSKITIPKNDDLEAEIQKFLNSLKKNQK